MNNKEKYREFCRTEKDIPIFSKDWWLDAVCGEDVWGVALYEVNHKIIASMPYVIRSKWGLKLSTLPISTPFLGPYIIYPKNQKYYKKLSWEKKCIDALLSDLPNFAYFYQSVDRCTLNLLPFYCKGFHISVGYTYRIKNILFDDLVNSYQNDARRRRRKKAVQAGVQIIESDDIGQFYSLNEMTFLRQQRNNPCTFQLIANIYKQCSDNNASKILIAKSKEGVAIAGAFLVFDATTVYYLMGGIHPDFKDVGAMCLLLSEAIRFALDTGRVFDFEGSMIPSIEKYFRSFGAKQAPYFNIEKSTSKILKLVKIFRG